MTINWRNTNLRDISDYVNKDPNNEELLHDARYAVRAFFLQRCATGINSDYWEDAEFQLRVLPMQRFEFTSKFHHKKVLIKTKTSNPDNPHMFYYFEYFKRDRKNEIHLGGEQVNIRDIFKEKKRLLEPIELKAFKVYPADFKKSIFR